MEFITPPPETQGRRSEHWRDVVRQLNENKGEWALVGNYSPGVATHIRRGKYPAFIPDGTDIDKHAYMSMHYEVTTRKNGTDRNDVYIRWVG